LLKAFIYVRTTSEGVLPHAVKQSDSTIRTARHRIVFFFNVLPPFPHRTFHAALARPVDRPRNARYSFILYFIFILITTSRMINAGLKRIIAEYYNDFDDFVVFQRLTRFFCRHIRCAPSPYGKANTFRGSPEQRKKAAAAWLRRPFGCVLQVTVF